MEGAHLDITYLYTTYIHYIIGPTQADGQSKMINNKNE